MTRWLTVLVAAVGVVGAWIAVQVASTSIRRRHLRRFLEERDTGESLRSCVDSFAGIDRERVELAYRWVQQLVEYPEAPLLADDDIWRDLRIDQGEADAKFEAAEQWKPSDVTSSGGTPHQPIRTVRDLMSEVLERGYEGYSRIAATNWSARKRTS